MIPDREGRKYTCIYILTQRLHQNYYFMILLVAFPNMPKIESGFFEKTQFSHDISHDIFHGYSHKCHKCSNAFRRQLKCISQITLNKIASIDVTLLLQHLPHNVVSLLFRMMNGPIRVEEQKSLSKFLKLLFYDNSMDTVLPVTYVQIITELIENMQTMMTNSIIIVKSSGTSLLKLQIFCRYLQVILPTINLMMMSSSCYCI